MGFALALFFGFLQDFDRDCFGFIFGISTGFLVDLAIALAFSDVSSRGHECAFGFGHVDPSQKFEAEAA